MYVLLYQKYTRNFITIGIHLSTFDNEKIKIVCNFDRNVYSDSNLLCKCFCAIVLKPDVQLKLYVASAKLTNSLYIISGS